MFQRQEVSLNQVRKLIDVRNGLSFELLLGHEHLLEWLTHLSNRPKLLHSYKSAELLGQIRDCLQVRGLPVEEAGKVNDITELETKQIMGLGINLKVSFTLRDELVLA